MRFATGLAMTCCFVRRSFHCALRSRSSTGTCRRQEVNWKVADRTGRLRFQVEALANGQREQVRTL
jgi:hypothetical protein